MDIAQGGYIMDLAGEAFLNNVTDEARLDSTFLRFGEWPYMGASD